MNLSFLIAKRYLISKKSHNIVNTISMISLGGIVIATAALICILSLFNGFTSLVEDTFNSFDPDLKIMPSQGKVFSKADFPIHDVQNMQGVDVLSESLDENALLKFSDRQRIVTFKGVSPNFDDIADVQKVVIHGEYTLGNEEVPYCLLGAGVAYELGVRPGFLSPLEIFTPRREGKVNLLNPSSAFNKENTFLSGVFSLNQANYDENMIIIPIDVARKLLDYTDEVSSIDIKLKQGTDTKGIKNQLSNRLGEDFVIKDRFEQQDELYKMINIEKWMTFLIVFVIEAISIFNIVGSLSILIIEKKNDIAIFKSLGMQIKDILRVFFTEGMMIVFLGMISGLFLGLLICFLQMKFGFLKMGNADDMFLAYNVYPVVVKIQDILLVALTVLSVGFIAVLYPVKNLKKTL